METGYRCRNKGISSLILLVTFLVPISAIILGNLYLGERLSLNAYIGMGIIFIGLIAIDGRLLKRLWHKNH